MIIVRILVEDGTVMIIDANAAIGVYLGLGIFANILAVGSFKYTLIRIKLKFIFENMNIFKCLYLLLRQE
jgi:hypothetical protein